MSDSVPVAIRKAFVAQLAAATLSQAIAPAGSYADWELLLEDSDLHVDVVTVISEQKSELAARGGKVKFTVPVDIAVRKRFDVTDQDSDTGRTSVDAVDVLTLLVQEIYLLFMPTATRQPGLDAFEDAVWQDTKVLANPDRKSLRENHQFTGVVRVTFAAFQDQA